jgi:hypothetical protein
MLLALQGARIHFVENCVKVAKSILLNSAFLTSGWYHSFPRGGTRGECCQCCKKSMNKSQQEYTVVSGAILRITDVMLEELGVFFNLFINF